MRYLLIVLLLPSSSLGSTLTNGPLGIDANGLRGPNGEILTGFEIKIGQVEILRPADPDIDGPTTENNDINPAQVSIQRQTSPPFNDLGGSGTFAFLSYATEVAGVMISSVDGVSREASLYADGYVNQGPADPAALLSIQFIATTAGGNKEEGRVISNTWQKELPGGDGFSYQTLGVDWMATRYNSLLVFALNDDLEVGVDFDAPADNFNGITVAASQRVDGAGAYRQAWETVTLMLLRKASTMKRIF